MLGNEFTLYTPGARRLYHFEFHEEEALLGAEIRRTIEGLAAAAGPRIAKGQLTQRDADGQAAPLLAIASDVAAQIEWRVAGGSLSGWSLTERLRELGAATGVTWSAKIAALRAEIEARRTGYPADVAKGRLTSDQAKQQLERLEAVHDLYWRHGFAFDGTRAELLELGNAVADHALHQQQAAA